MSRRLTYVAITPARDEADQLPRLASCMVEQTHRPERWVIVDNGSTDATSQIVRRLSEDHDWIVGVQAPNAETRPGAPIVRAFNVGLDAVLAPPHIVVKLDADVSFDRDYFERLISSFAEDGRLGIASGVCWELTNGEWRPVAVTGDHVRGATRAYRWTCLDDVGPLPAEMGWDGIDEWKAAMLGWTTRSVTDLAFFHHRAVGERDGARTARWLAEGRCCHYMGYRPSYVMARAIGRAIRDRDPAAFAMPYAFVRCAMRGEPRYDDPRVRRYLQQQQGLRHLPGRLVESFGLRRAG